MRVSRFHRRLLALAAALLIFSQSGCCTLGCTLFGGGDPDCLTNCLSKSYSPSRVKGKQPILVDGTPQVGKKVLAP